MSGPVSAVPLVRPAEDGNEREILTGLLDSQRASVINKVAGMSDEQARTASAPPSPMTPAWIVGHLAGVERFWFSIDFAGMDLTHPWVDAAGRPVASARRPVGQTSGVMFLRRLAFAVAVVISLVVLFAPGSDVPSAPRGVDKVVHFGTFALLAATGLLVGFRWLPLGVGLLLYGVASEMIQAWTPLARDGNLPDFAADEFGAAVVVAADLWRRRAVAARAARRRPRLTPPR